MNDILQGETLNLNLDTLTSLGFPMALSCVIALILIAFYSYRVFKIELAAAGAMIFGNIGYSMLAPLIFRSMPTPEGVNLYAIVGVICAIIGAAVMASVHKLAIFAVGGACGFLLGQTVYSVILEKAPGLSEGFLGTEMGYYVVAGSTALAVAVLMLLLFKPLFIIVTSVGGMYLATLTVVHLVYPGIYTLGDIGELATLALGGILGITAAIKQFKNS
jgi:hypothetical protein